MYALVNNAGVAGVSTEEIIRTNVYGTKLMSEAFIPLLDQNEGKIVNLGSGAGPAYV